MPSLLRTCSDLAEESTLTSAPSALATGATGTYHSPEIRVAGRMAETGLPLTRKLYCWGDCAAAVALKIHVSASWRASPRRKPGLEIPTLSRESNISAIYCTDARGGAELTTSKVRVMDC